MQVGLQIVCRVINNSLDRSLLINLSLIDFKVTQNIDSFGAERCLQKVVRGKLDVSENLGFELIRELLYNGDTSDC